VFHFAGNATCPNDHAIARERIERIRERFRDTDEAAILRIRCRPEGMMEKVLIAFGHIRFLCCGEEQTRPRHPIRAIMARFECLPRDVGGSRIRVADESLQPELSQ
jgi:hypothetical protein